MNRFILISRHTIEDCQLAINHFKQYHATFLTHFEWGCYDNDHSAYAFVEAESHDQARLAVPPLFRDKTEVIKLTTFKPSGAQDKIHV